VEAARAFAAAPSGWIVLTGPSGCGKTHLAAAVANRCIERGSAALFMVVPDLLDHLRASYQQGSEMAYDDLFEVVRNAPVLVLDDLGVQSGTEWANEKLFQLINHRYNAQLPTLFTTNLELVEFDQRLQTRLGDPVLSQVFALEAGGSAGVSDLDSLGLPLLRGMTFKSFNQKFLAADTEELKEVQNAYRQAMSFAQEPRDWLVIAGQTGRGKTRLAAAIGNYCREAGLNVMFVVVPDLLDRLRSSYSPQSPGGFDRLFEQVRSVPLLILDDLGSESGTPWADEKLFQLLNHRYNASLPTVITTNTTAGEMQDRVLTRLTDPAISSMLIMGRFDFWGQTAAKTPAKRASRSRR
jgi:DNA replication protein DnaC